MNPLQTLLSLAELQFTFTIQPDEDWVEGIAYVDSTQAPVALDGIVFQTTVRKALGDPSVLFFPTTTNGAMQILPATVGGLNSVLAMVVPVSAYPAFLPVGSYVFGTQGIVGTATRTIWSGSLIVQQGVP